MNEDIGHDKKINFEAQISVIDISEQNFIPMNDISNEALAMFFDDTPLTDVTLRKTPKQPDAGPAEKKEISYSFSSLYMQFNEDKLPHKQKSLQVFYQNILKAIRKNEDEVTMITATETPAAGEFAADTLTICWGTLSETEFTHFIPQQHPNGGLLLHIPDVEAIAGSTDYKTRLWQQLKILFKV